MSSVCFEGTGSTPLRDQSACAKGGRPGLPHHEKTLNLRFSVTTHDVSKRNCLRRVTRLVLTLKFISFVIFFKKNLACHLYFQRFCLFLNLRFATPHHQRHCWFLKRQSMIPLARPFFPLFGLKRPRQRQRS